MTAKVISDKDFDIFSKACALGLELANWQSDLYIKSSPEADKLVAEYTQATGFKTSVFMSQNHKWHEVPFQYSPFWQHRRRCQSVTEQHNVEVKY